MSVPTVIAERWLYGLLSADSALAALIGGIHTDYVPQGLPWESAGSPVRYVVVVNQSVGNDLNALGAVRVLTNPLYLVKAVGRTASYVDLDPIATRIDQLLQRASGTTTGGSVLSCVRERPFRLPEATPGGVRVCALGGLYRLQIQES